MMENNIPARGRNVQRQLAIFEVAGKAAGKSLSEIKQMLSDAFARRHVSGTPGTWLDAVATEASYGKPYLVDLPAAVAADSVMESPDPRVEGFLKQRRRLRESETNPDQQRRRPARPAFPGRSAMGLARRPDGGTTSARWILAATLGAVLALAAVTIMRSIRHRGR